MHLPPDLSGKKNSLTHMLSFINSPARPAKIPTDDPLSNILPGQSEGEFTTYGLAGVQPTLVIYLSFVFEIVLIVLRVLR